MLVPCHTGLRSDSERNILNFRTLLQAPPTHLGACGADLGREDLVQEVLRARSLQARSPLAPQQPCSRTLDWSAVDASRASSTDKVLRDNNMGTAPRANSSALPAPYPTLFQCRTVRRQACRLDRQRRCGGRGLSPRAPCCWQALCVVARAPNGSCTLLRAPHSEVLWAPNL